MISKDINKALEILHNNGIIGMPTETVYGLAAKMSSEIAIQKIFELKQRPLSNPLIIHISKIDDLSKLAQNIPTIAFDLAAVFWPGPLTFVLDKKDFISQSITANQPTVAVRMPNHEVALTLISELESPVVAPSANPYMAVSPTTAKHVFDYFKEKLPLVLEGGNCKKGIESTIIGFENNSIIIYRNGSISKEMLQNKTNCKVIEFYTKESNIITPGMHKKHYSPKTKVILTENLLETYQKHQLKNTVVISFQNNTYNFKNHFILSENGNFDEAAYHLYEYLIQIDSLGFDLIIIEKLPEIGIGISINDRLKRASAT